MSGFASYEVQQAVDTVLVADATLLAMLGDGVNGIVDNGVQTTDLTFPYIIYTSNTATEWDTQTSNGSEIYITISIFSKTGDRQEINGIMRRVHELLHDAALTVSGNDSVQCRWDGLTEIFPDDSKQGRIFQGVIRFKIITQAS